jgi:integrase
MRKLCEEKRATADGTSSIYFQYFPDSTHRVFLNTGITIPPKFWDCHKQRIKDSLPTTYGDHQKLNDEIIRQYRLAEDLVKLVKSSGIENPGEFVKEKFSPGLRLDTMIQCDWKLRTQMEKAETSFFLQQMEDDIHAKSRKVKPGTLTVFQSMRLHFQAFEKHRGKAIQFESLDFQFYEDLIDFLTHHYTLPRKKDKAVGLRVNTIGKTIHQFRVFIKDRVKRRIIPAIDLSDYKVPTEETDAVYLAPDEIGQIYTLDLTERPELTPARNLFVLGCLTGLRFSDFSNLKPEDLQQDMLHKKQEKSVHWVVIPLRKEAKAIFTEEFKNDIPRICNSEFNQKIKEIGKLAGIERPIKFSYRKANRMIDVKKPKYSWITSHTARRSFCTNEFLAGTPVYLIMKISGHKREKDFYRYIRVDPQEAALKVKELWMQRGDIEVFKNPLKKAINLTAFQASDTDCIEKGQAVNLQNQ